MEEIKLTIHPFEMDTLKEAAKKVQEESGEAFAEYVILQEQKDRSTTRLADEIADTIQASCNLAARYGIDLQSAMERCEQRNRSRGRYGDANTNGIRESSVGDTANRRWMDSDSGGNNSPTCTFDRSGVVDSDGSRDAHYKTAKSPEEMSVSELIEALYLANGYRGNGDGYCEDGSCTKTLGVDWCDTYHTCRICRKHLLDLLKTAHKREVASLEYEKSYYKEKSEAYERDYDDVRRRITGLAHERDGLRNRLAELSEAGITSLHRLLRVAMGEAKNITHNARVYIDKQQGSKDEHCGSRRSDRRNHGGDCGAERARERVLSEEPPAQEMSEREKVLERLRGYAVYMAEPPSENANRLLACITGNKDARIACVNDVVSTRDKLIELLSTPGWDYCKTCELVKSDDDE